MITPLPPSLYACTARPAAPAPLLDGDRRVSVAVIGGGFTGLSTALHLAERKADAMVLEAHEPGWGASGRNGGQVNPGLKADPDDVEASFGPELGRRMVNFAWTAPRTLFGLVARHQIRCDARQGGTLRVADHPGRAAMIARTMEQCARRGMDVAMLDKDAVAERTGTGRYIAAMLDRSGGDLQPLDYARGLVRAAAALGAAVHGGTPVRSLTRSAGRWRLTTPTGTVTADAVVLCTNGYTDDLWPGLRQTVVPVFSAMAATARLSDAVARAVMPTRSVLYENGHITVYLRVDQCNRLLIGGRGPQRPMSSLGPVRYLLRHALRLWPVLRGAAWTHAWNGQLAITKDHYPHLHQLAPGLFACLGYNGRGLALSTAMGAEVARFVTGTDAKDLSMPVSALRAIPMHRLWRVGVAAKTLEGRIRDQLGL